MNKPTIWCIVPAAGVGQRMQADVPKQYLPLAGSTVLEITLSKLLSIDDVSGMVVALQDDDPFWPTLNIQSSKIVDTVTGGAERSDSVFNALTLLLDHSEFDFQADWVLVHDAARPCVSLSDINRLIKTVIDDTVESSQNINQKCGGLLATPVRDTMKRASGKGVVTSTVERDGLWHALTPQLFPAQLLYKALSNARDNDISITDESSAIEHIGLQPVLVQGRDDNIKITRPLDLRLAAMFLEESLSE